MASTLKIYVVDDDDDARLGLHFLLNAVGYEPKLYDSAVRFLESAAEAPPGCVITDVRMPEMDGIELVRRLEAASSPHRVVVVTGHGDVQLAVEAMKAGAVDFLEKPFSDDALLRAVATAFEVQDRRSLQGAAQARYAQVLSDLTPRELQVLDGILAGQMNKIIAHSLGISERTVEVYRANIMQKTGAGSLPELVRIALIAGR